MVTALIGDIASHVGCAIGLKDAITAICIVALGTSVPGKQLDLLAHLKASNNARPLSGVILVDIR